MRRNSTPPIERSEQAMHGGLQRRRVIAHMAGFPERLVDCRFERDDTADELATLGLRIRQMLIRRCQHARKAARDLGRQIGE